MPYHDDLCHLTDLRHFASSSGGLVVSIDPDTGTVFVFLCCIYDEFTECISDVLFINSC